MKRHFSKVNVLLAIGIISSLLTGIVLAAEPEDPIVIFDTDFALPAIPTGDGSGTPVCVDRVSGLIVAGCDGAVGPQGPPGADQSSEIVELTTKLDAAEQALCELAEATNTVIAYCGPLDGDLRLVDGSTSSEGRLEMFYSGQWGTVCDDRFDINDAAVACGQLGFSGADAALFTFNVVDGTGPIQLDDLQCVGTEERLIDCVHREPVGSHNCSHFEDAGVQCTPN